MVLLLVGCGGIEAPNPPQSTVQLIQVMSGELKLPVGHTLQLTATGDDGADLTGKVAWSTSDATLATVPPGGLATALAPGNVTFTASLDGSAGSASVRVTNATLRGVEVRPRQVTLAAGTTRQFRAFAVFDDLSDLEVTSQADWSVPGGLLQAETDSTVSASFRGFTGSATATVTSASLVALEITPSNPALPPGGELQLTATGTFDDGTRQTLSNLVWGGVADGRGRVRAAGVATAQIGSVSTSTTVTVDRLVGLAIRPDRSSVAQEASLRFVAIGTYANGATSELSAAWSSSDPARASISPEGIATGHEPGPTTITARAGKITASTGLTVEPSGVLPPAPPGPQFQVLLDERLERDQTLHLSFVGTVLGDWYWLAGNALQKAGPDSQKAFASSYDFTTDELPLDATGRYRVLTIPSELALTGRLYLTLDAPAALQIAGNGLIAPPDLQQNQTRYDFVELVFAPDHTATVSTTNQDFFALGLAVQASSGSFGLDLSGSTPVASLVAELRALQSPYGQNEVRAADGGFARFLSPGQGQVGQDLDPAIFDGYTFFVPEPLQFLIMGREYSGQVINGVLEVDTNDTHFSVPRPTTADVYKSSGPLDPFDKLPEVSDALVAMTVAFERGVFTEPALWNTPSAFYPAGGRFNPYAALLHQRFLNGSVSAFSFDQTPMLQGVTSMTLVVDEE